MQEKIEVKYINLKSKWPQFLKKNWPYFVLFILLIVATASRMYLLKNEIQFIGDQATHAQIISNIYSKAQFPPQGPPSSGGDGLYHGAYYYYLQTIPQIVTHGSPVGPSVFTALLSIAVVFLIYESVSTMHTKSSGLFAAALYSFSAQATFFGRFIWNPNLVPFFFALALYASSRVGRKKWAIPLLAFAIGSISQVHIGSIFFVAILIILSPLLFIIEKNYKIWIVSFAAFLLPWLPTVAHELRHGFPLYHALISLFGKGSNTTFIGHISQAWQFVSSFFEMSMKLEHSFLILAMAATVVFLIFKTNWKNFREMFPVLFFFLSLVLSFLIVGYLQLPLFIHFAEQFFVILPICLGLLLGLIAHNKLTTILVMPVVVIMIYFNWFVYQKEIIRGPQAYRDELRICQIIKDDGIRSANVIMNGVVNPNYIQYVCAQSEITLGEDGPIYQFTTDFMEKFEYNKI